METSIESNLKEQFKSYNAVEEETGAKMLSFLVCRSGSEIILSLILYKALRQARNFRHLERFSKVFLRPDQSEGSEEEHAQDKDLVQVLILLKMGLTEPNKLHYMVLGQYTQGTR